MSEVKGYRLIRYSPFDGAPVVVQVNVQFRSVAVRTATILEDRPIVLFEKTKCSRREIEDPELLKKVVNDLVNIISKAARDGAATDREMRGRGDDPSLPADWPQFRKNLWKAFRDEFQQLSEEARQ